MRSDSKSSTVQADTLPLVRDIAKLRRQDVALAGGKGANLGELTAIGMPVPPGYVVLVPAFVQVLEEAGLHGEFVEQVRNVAVDDRHVLQSTSERLQAALRGIRPRADLRRAMLAPYAEMLDGAAVAVRSSATAEDTAAASFAGMNETYLGVRGEQALWRAIVDCWASLYAPRVIAYRRDLGIDEAGIAIAVVVQRMVDAAWAGVMLTEHPDGGSDRMAIEAAPGLGEVVVGGEVTPAHYDVEKRGLRIVHSEPGHQDHRVVLSERGVERRPVEPGSVGPLAPETVCEIAELGLRIEAHYGVPQDIEWAVDATGGVHITQARPITAGRGRRRAEPAGGEAPDRSAGRILLHGVGSGFGVAFGKPVVVLDYDPDAEFHQGDVLVTRMTTPDWFPLIRKAAALVTDEGGATSHAAIVARELGLAGVVGTATATRDLAAQSMVTVDGAQGLVIEGRVRREARPERTPAAAAGAAAPITGTAIWCNLSAPDRAAEIAAGDVDGVGLVRAEMMLLEALDGQHPRLLVEQHREDAFVAAMTNALRRLARPFGVRPVVYRTYDFRTNEFRRLQGGERFEPEEANPMIGFRGCARYLADPSLLQLELRAVRAAREQHGCANLRLMLPFVRTAHEILACSHLLAEAGLGPRQVEVHAMAEVPSIIDNLEILVECGFRGISIGSNDLTQLLLGVDRDSKTLAGTFDARDPAVLAYLGRLIGRARELGLHTAICGQAPSLYGGFAEHLVDFGIDAISVNPDAVVQVRRAVAAAERRILLQSARRASH